MSQPKRLYHVESVTPKVILSGKNRAVNGHEILFTIVPLNEQHRLEFEIMDKDIIDKTIRDFIDNRLAINDLGE